MRLKALLFDVDGTLAETERDGHRPAFNRAFADYCLHWQWDESLYGRLLAVTGGKERMFHFASEYLGSSERPEDLDTLIPELHTAKNRHYAAIIDAGEISLRPGIRRIINEAHKAGVRLAIATTTTRVNVIALLESLLGKESIGWFEVIATADEVPDKKPSPDVYQYVLDQMGLKADECIAVEDSENGIKASIALGIPTLVTVSEYNRDGDFSEALLVVDNLGEPGSPCHVLGGRAASVVGEGVSTVDLPLLDGILT